MSKFEEKILRLKKLKKMSPEEIAALSDAEKIARMEITKKNWKREEMYNRVVGYYALWCFVLGTVGTVYLVWKLLKWLL